MRTKRNVLSFPSWPKILFVLGLFLISTSSALAGPAISRGEQLLPITGEECMKRALGAFQAEGYRATQQGANLYGGEKDIHSAYIMCNSAPEGKIWVNIVVASDAQSGTVPGAERVKLQQRMAVPGAPKQLVTSCWRWSVELKSGARTEGMLRMSSDGKASIPIWGLNGTWTAQGSTYYFDWGRGAGKQDVMTLSGSTLTGSNFETNWIRGDVINCP